MTTSASKVGLFDKTFEKTVLQPKPSSLEIKSGPLKSKPSSVESKSGSLEKSFQASSSSSSSSFSLSTESNATESLGLSNSMTLGRGSILKEPNIHPDRGTVVEVLVAWGERVISSHHFDQKGLVTVGTNTKCDVVVPLLGTNKDSHQLLKIDTLATAYIEQSMSGDYVKDDLSKVSFSELMRKGQFEQASKGYKLQIPQGCMLRVGLQGDLVSIYIRYVPETAKPLVAPILNLTASEVTGVILAIVVAMTMGLYMMIYSPSVIDQEDKMEEQVRKAVVKFMPPKVKKKVVKSAQKKVVAINKQKKTEAPKKAPTPQAPKKKVTPPKPVVAQSPKPTVRKKPGKAAAVKSRKKSKNNKRKRLTSTRHGGARKTGKKGSSLKSKKVDPSKTGLLGVFGSKGTQQALNKAYDGSGELAGIADTATGASGQLSDRKGENIGTRIKDTGGRGRGKSTVGISGVGTQGKGTGNYGEEGLGSLGKKGAVVISTGGQGAEFVGSLDRAAIRRVIERNKRAIKNCYDRELNKNKDLYGKLVLRWNIIEGGRVTKASVVSSSLEGKAVANCIIRRLKTWKFPEPPSNTEGEVTYPFVFTSQ